MYVLNSKEGRNKRHDKRQMSGEIVDDQDHGNRVFYDRRASDVNCNVDEWRDGPGEKKGGAWIIKAEG